MKLKQKILEIGTVKNVRIRSYSSLYFPTFGLNTERYGVSLRIQSECGKIRTRITPNMDSFHAVKVTNIIHQNMGLFTWEKLSRLQG